MRSLRSLFGVALLVALGVACFKLLPVYMSAYEFEDDVKEEAKLSVYSQRSEDDIHDAIMKKAYALQIPLQPDHVVVRRSGLDLTITTEYAVTIDLSVYPLVLKFHPESVGHKMTGLGM